MLKASFNPKLLKLARLEPKSTIKMTPKSILPAKTSPHEYTLVLDLDETLVHYSDIQPQAMLNVRPHCSKFLKQTAAHYEVVIFTAAM